MDTLFDNQHHTSTRRIKVLDHWWWVWDCTCGDSAEKNKNQWSHEEQAKRMAGLHCDQD